MGRFPASRVATMFTPNPARRPTTNKTTETTTINALSGIYLMAIAIYTKENIRDGGAERNGNMVSREPPKVMLTLKVTYCLLPTAYC